VLVGVALDEGEVDRCEAEEVERVRVSAGDVQAEALEALPLLRRGR